MRRACLVLAILAVLASCSTRRPLVGSDSGTDAASAMSDAGHDAAVVTMNDGGHDAATVAVDAGHDAATVAVDGGHDGGSDGGHDAAVVTSSAPLLFSEYIEGSSGNDKALEIANIGTSSVSLTGCSVTLFANGATTMTATYPLTGSLASGAVITLCHSAATGFDPTTCTDSITGGVMGFNGDDALVLDCADGRVDVIGQVGTDPGTRWGTTPSTADETLQRDCSVTMGDANGSDAFDPAAEWTSAGSDVFDGLGTRGCP
jgi:hypothetical protein